MLSIKSLSISTLVTLILLLAGCVNQPRTVAMENLKVVNGKYYRQSVNPSPMIPMPIRIGEIYQCTMGNEIGTLSLISSEEWIYENKDKKEKEILSKGTGIYSNRMKGISPNGQIIYIAMAKDDNTKMVVTDGKQHVIIPCIQISNNAYALSEQQAQLYLHNQQIAQQQAMHNEQIAQQKSAQNSREWDAILDRQNQNFNTLYQTTNNNINSYQTPIKTNNYDYSFKSNEPKVYILTK